MPLWTRSWALGDLELRSGEQVLVRMAHPLAGRERDLDAVAALISGDETRLVTLTRPGGTGKTRLAVDVARMIGPEFPGGVNFISLAPVDNAAGAASAIAQGLGGLDTGDLPLE